MYKWIGNTGDKIEHSQRVDSESTPEDNLKRLMESPNLLCQTVKLDDTDFTPPKDVNFRYIDARGTSTF
jgi:hypothetical protein